MNPRATQFVTSVDLNADVGETEGDAALLAIVTSASVACGFHAGGPATMRRTVREAVVRGVVIGAHASYADRSGFGRRELGTRPEQIAEEVSYQVGALRAIASLEDASVDYVKLHGALYHRAGVDEELALILSRALASLGGLAVLAQAGSALYRACQQRGLVVVAEAYCDRAYRLDGRLVDRADPGAVLDDPARSAAQAVAIVLEGRVETADGNAVPVEAASLCLHGDTPRAIEHARSVRAALEQAGVELASFIPRGP